MATSSKLRSNTSTANISINHKKKPRPSPKKARQIHASASRDHRLRALALFVEISGRIPRPDLDQIASNKLPGVPDNN